MECVHLREVDAGTDNACWFVCAKGDPGAVAFYDGPDCADAEMAGELGGRVRDEARRLTGGNCAFADDDLNILVHLASRAIEAGLTDKLSPGVQQDIARLTPKDTP